MHTTKKCIIIIDIICNEGNGMETQCVQNENVNSGLPEEKEKVGP